MGISPCSGIGWAFVVVVSVFRLSNYFLSQPMSSVLLPFLSLIPLGGMSKQLCGAVLSVRLNHNTFPS